MYKVVGAFLTLLSFFLAGREFTRHYKNRLEALKKNAAELGKQADGYKKLGINPKFDITDKQELAASERSILERARCTNEIKALESCREEIEKIIADLERSRGRIAQSAGLLGALTGLALAVILY